MAAMRNAAQRMATVEQGPGQGYRSDLKPFDNVKKSEGGNSADYLAARIKHDRQSARLSSDARKGHDQNPSQGSKKELPNQGF